MSLRRRDSRLEVVSAGGILRLWRDVIGYRTPAGEYLVISSEAGIKGEHHSIYRASGAEQPIPVRVLDSRPTIVEGSVRHQLRLAPLEIDTTSDLEVEGE